MIQRCSPKYKQAKDYFERGISVCERWKNSFNDFLADMGEKPLGLTLDRVDNNGNYEPGNCEWATRKRQTENRRKCVMVEWQGRKLPLSVVAAENHVPYSTLYIRHVWQGMGLVEAIARKPRRRKRRGSE